MLQKKSNAGKIFSLIFVFILVLMLFFSHWQLNRQSNKMNTIQETIIQNNQDSVSIVNFINAQYQGVQP